MFDRDWIASHIPHHGRMCLLDAIESWNETEISCRASSHRLADNPLRENGTLGIINGIEYAAQCMAAHGALLANAGKAPSAGFLTSVRDVQWHRSRLDDIDADLIISAERISGNEINILYRFSLSAQGNVLLCGRASVMLDAEGF